MRKPRPLRLCHQGVLHFAKGHDSRGHDQLPLHAEVWQRSSRDGQRICDHRKLRTISSVEKDAMSLLARKRRGVWQPKKTSGVFRRVSSWERTAGNREVGVRTEAGKRVMDDAAKINSHPERLTACRLVFVDADARVFDAAHEGAALSVCISSL